MTRRRGTGAHRARRRTLPIVVASLVLHGVVLGPLALGGLGIDVPPYWGDHPDIFPVVNVELVRRPSLPGVPATGRATPGRDTTFMETPVSAIGPSADDTLFRGGPIPSPTPRTVTRPLTPRPMSPGTADPPMDRGSEPWQARANRLASGPGRTGLDCRRAETLPPIEREICERRFAVADAATATARLGQRRLTRAESMRESTFAAIGDQALADYDRRRAPLKPNSRANPCPESPTPGDPCAFTVKGRIWSSRDGWLPDLPGRQ